MILANWTLRLPDRQPKSVILPHVFDRAKVRFEGPAAYETRVQVPENGWLVFEGVSYQAKVAINGETVAEHQGIWDAFSISLAQWAGQTVAIEVEVVKNGGATFPVKDVLSGFLPYVFHTFGGIYQPVRVVVQEEDPVEAKPKPAPRIAVEGARLFLDGLPWFMRGVLTWGWYPEIGHTNPPEDTIRHEIETAKSLGFNLVKFCLWMPSHRHLELLDEAGLLAWIELPLWAPSADPGRQEAMATELERIVLQYRHHANVVCWTVGCELSHETPPELRERLTNMVQDLTGCPLVKDNSGGAEMYGGDLREFGTFYDFHPYCDTPFYPCVLDDLSLGPRTSMPILLGEFNDIDAHRDLPRLRREAPFWTSQDADLNDQGVRWQQDLPNFLHTTRFASRGPDHDSLRASSRQKALFMRKTVHEAVRARGDFAGTVITGWRDTPISTSGVVDDWGMARYSAEEMLAWNAPDCLFLIPTRRPPWVRGGNRPGFLDPFCFFEGPVFWKVGIASERGVADALRWRIEERSGLVVAEGTCEAQRIPALTPTEIGAIWADIACGEYRLHVQFAGAQNAWDFSVVEARCEAEFAEWAKHDPSGRLDDLVVSGSAGLLTTNWVPGPDPSTPTIAMLGDGPVVACPFWREAAYEFRGSLWKPLPVADRWHRWLSVSGDAALAPSLLADLERSYPVERAMVRVDARTYEETCLLARVGTPGGLWLTTLRPDGGLGSQPLGLTRSPSGWSLLRALARELSQ